MLKQSTKFAANRSKRRQNFNGSGSAMLLFRFSHIHGRLFKSLRRVYVVRYWLKIFVFIDGRRCVFLILPNFSLPSCKSMLINSFQLPLTSTKIISSYRLTYTYCSDFDRLSLYVTEIR